jgi:hypothetical protein
MMMFCKIQTTARPSRITTIGRQQDVDIAWPRSSFLQMFSDSNKVSVEDSMGQCWKWYWPPTGCHVRKQVKGTVIDADGNPVSGATVLLFNTATGQLVDTQVTASDRSYSCGDPNQTTCLPWPICPMRQIRRGPR